MEKEKSCGCIIIDNNKVALVKEPEGHWGFPKGHVEANETEIETAIREVKEEINLDVQIDGLIKYEQTYITKKNTEKTVVFFVTDKWNGKIEPQITEVVDAGWFSFNEAFETLTYDNTKDLLKKVIEDMKN